MNSIVFIPWTTMDALTNAKPRLYSIVHHPNLFPFLIFESQTKADRTASQSWSEDKDK